MYQKVLAIGLTVFAVGAGLLFLKDRLDHPRIPVANKEEIKTKLAGLEISRRSLERDVAKQVDFMDTAKSSPEILCNTAYTDYAKGTHDRMLELSKRQKELADLLLASAE